VHPVVAEPPDARLKIPLDVDANRCTIRTCGRCGRAGGDDVVLRVVTHQSIAVSVDTVPSGRYVRDEPLSTT
jgi:hypothetical protein